MEAVHLFIVSFQDGNSLAIKGNSASESGVCCRLVSNAATSPSLPLSLSLSLGKKSPIYQFNNYFKWIFPRLP